MNSIVIVDHTCCVINELTNVAYIIEVTNTRNMEDKIAHFTSKIEITNFTCEVEITNFASKIELTDIAYMISLVYCTLLNVTNVLNRTIVEELTYVRNIVDKLTNVTNMIDKLAYIRNMIDKVTYLRYCTLVYMTRVDCTIMNFTYM